MSKNNKDPQWFQVPPVIYFNRGCLTQALKDIKTLGLRKAFIVTDNAFKTLPGFSVLTKELESCNIQYEVFSNVSPDPTDVCVYEGLEILRKSQADFIIAIGGGSPMDAAKVIRILHDTDLNIPLPESKGESLREKLTSLPPLGRYIKKFVCIPTTSGTGSEVSPIAVVTDTKKQLKQIICDYGITPDIAIVDVDFVLSMPKLLASATGMDAMTHAIESYVSTLSTSYTKCLSLQAISILNQSLAESVNSAKLEARENVHNAATIAGMAFSNAMLGIVHSAAHQLGSTFHIPHGLANTMLLCQVITFNGNGDAKLEYAEISDFIHLTKKTATCDDKVLALVNRLSLIKIEIGIPKSIQEYGIVEIDFINRVDMMSDNALKDVCTGTNPRVPTTADFKQIYLNAYYGTF